MTRYYLGMPVAVTHWTDSVWTWGTIADGRCFKFWTAQLKRKPWGTA